LAVTKPVNRLSPNASLRLILAITVVSCGILRPAIAATNPDCGPDANCSQSPNPEQQDASRKAAEAERAQASNRSLDWYPINELTPQQLEITPTYCDGAYIEPANKNPEAGQDPETAPLRASADNSEITKSQRARLYGNVDLAKGSLRVRADEATFDTTTDQLSAQGNIELREKGILVRGDSALVNAESGTGTLEGAQYVFYEAHARGAADQIKRESETIVRLTNGAYTHCSPSSKAWLLTAEEIELDQGTGVGSASSAKLRIADVPIFYWPYLTFPIDNRRRSGLLFPSIGATSSSGGLDLSVPFYWNIAPNWDATIAARYIAARGLAAEVEARHLNRYSSWVVAGSWINDQEYGDSRWFYTVNEAGILPGGWVHGINYTEVSDKDYLTDLSGATSLEIKRSTSLQQSANIAKAGRFYNFSAQLVQYQVIDDFVAEQYRRLPQLFLQVETDRNSFRPTWLLKAQISQFDIDNRSRAIGSRVYLEPGFHFPMYQRWGYLTPTFKLKSVQYDLNDDHDLRPGQPVEDERPATTLPMASLDAGLYFERPSQWFGQSFTTTLEPRIYYLYTKYEDQNDQPLFDTGFTTFDYNQLFRESRFTGYDRIPDANQLSFGVTSRLIQDSSGTETLWASLGQIFYFNDRLVNIEQGDNIIDTSDNSQLAGELGYQWTRHLRSYVSALYETGGGQLNQAGGRIRYRTNRGLVLNLGHNYRRQGEITINGVTVDNTIRQSDISAIVPIKRHWALMGRYNYDHTNTRTLGQVFGVEYNSCCWKARLAYQKGLDSSLETERGIYFQIEMKGLGGTDTGVNSVLEDSIVGFEEYEERDHF
jgi:LPS-assembly protein